MSWQERLSTASFRGMSFLTESHDAKLGRRLVVHEFPGSDTPLLEDLGAKAAELRVNAYFIGADYDLYRDKFLYLLQQPGAAWLNHPWLGLLEVRAKEWSLSESNDKGGYCTIGIDFVPAGMEIAEPTIDLVDSAVKKFELLEDAAEETFSLSKMGSDAVNGFIAEVSSKLDYLRDVISIARLPLTWAQQITGQIQGIKGDFNELMALPSQYVSALRGLTTSIFGADIEISDADRPRVVALLSQLASRYPINANLLVKNVPATSALELPINLEKDKALQAVFLVSAAGKLALADYTDAKARDTSLAAVLAAIDFMVPQLPDAVFQAALAARVALLDALNAQVLDITQTVEVFEFMPATVLAHRFELDETVFNAMNDVTHPLFVEGVVYG
ncbi:DNA circularization N-terminal domain-containing protein [Methylosoma difficile]